MATPLEVDVTAKILYFRSASDAKMGAHTFFTRRIQDISQELYPNTV